MRFAIVAFILPEGSVIYAMVGAYLEQGEYNIRDQQKNRREAGDIEDNGFEVFEFLD